MQLQSLTAMLNKKMDRREFLRTLFLIALTVIGLGIIAKHIGTSSPATTSGTATPKPHTTDSYGG